MTTATIEETNQAREESEGRTMRAELAGGHCQHAWRDYPHVSYHGPDGDESIYRQHRCGRDLDHKGRCRCRYCSTER